MPKPCFNALPEEKRQRVMSSARREFIEYGYQRSSIRRIMLNANASVGSFYQYFDDKFDLVNTLCADFFDKYKPRYYLSSQFWYERPDEEVECTEEEEKFFYDTVQSFPSDVQLRLYFESTMGDYLTDAEKQVKRLWNEGKLRQSVDPAFAASLLTRGQYLVSMYAHQKDLDTIEKRRPFYQMLEEVLMHGLIVDD